jgi:hypothetical protein
LTIKQEGNTRLSKSARALAVVCLNIATVGIGNQINGGFCGVLLTMYRALEVQKFKSKRPAIAIFVQRYLLQI